ncbi:MAG: VanZ family protein [Candidatus Pacearchaeota archaeon]
MLNLLERKPIIASIFLVLLAGFIWYTSSIPVDPVPGIGFRYKSEVYHFGIFFLLCLMAIVSFSRGGKSENGKGIAILFSILYAVADEIHQSFVAGRSVSPGDFITDSIGIFVAFLFYNIRLRNLKE